MVVILDNGFSHAYVILCIPAGIYFFNNGGYFRQQLFSCLRHFCAFMPDIAFSIIAAISYNGFLILTSLLCIPAGIYFFTNSGYFPQQLFSCLRHFCAFQLDLIFSIMEIIFDNGFSHAYVIFVHSCLTLLYQ